MKVPAVAKNPGLRRLLAIVTPGDERARRGDRPRPPVRRLQSKPARPAAGLRGAARRAVDAVETRRPGSGRYGRAVETRRPGLGTLRRRWVTRTGRDGVQRALGAAWRGAPVPRSHPGPGRRSTEPVLDLRLLRGVAQSGSARALGARRRGFKSRLPDPVLTAVLAVSHAETGTDPASSARPSAARAAAVSTISPRSDGGRTVGDQHSNGRCRSSTVERATDD